jgi:hypothetical protein
LLEINSYDDLFELNKKYRNWAAVAQDYNGINITNYSQVRQQVLLSYDWCSHKNGISMLFNFRKII